MEWEKELRSAFEEVVWKIPEKVGIIFSGGIDSSLLAYLINMHDKDVHLYTAGVKDSHDSKWAKHAALLLGLPLKFIEAEEEEIIEGIKDIKSIEPGVDAMSVAIDLTHYFVSKHSDNSILISGQGSDELFLGYKKYEKKNTSSQDLRKVIEIDSVREKKIAQRWQKKLLFPYLDEDLIKTASAIPEHLKLKNGIHKYILREMATSIGLSEEIASKPKKSAQYSSGFKYKLDNIAANNGKLVHEFIMDL